jgi:hypothetical protein
MHRGVKVLELCMSAISDRAVYLLLVAASFLAFGAYVAWLVVPVVVPAVVREVVPAVVQAVTGG